MVFGFPSPDPRRTYQAILRWMPSRFRRPTRWHAPARNRHRKAEVASGRLAGPRRLQPLRTGALRLDSQPPLPARDIEHAARRAPSWAGTSRNIVTVGKEVKIFVKPGNICRPGRAERGPGPITPVADGRRKPRKQPKIISADGYESPPEPVIGRVAQARPIGGTTTEQSSLVMPGCRSFAFVIGLS
jgi:hypothetical protein